MSGTNANGITLELAVSVIRRTLVWKSGAFTVTATTRFKDLQVTSLDIAVAIMDLEDEIGYQLDIDSIRDVEVVGDLVRLARPACPKAR